MPGTFATAPKIELWGISSAHPIARIGTDTYEGSYEGALPKDGFTGKEEIVRDDLLFD